MLSSSSVAHDHEQTIYEIATRIAENVPTQWDYEILLIDDGSEDNTWSEIERIVESPPECNCGSVRAIRFRRGTGMASALNVGFEEARGDYVLTLSADLDDDPAEIPRFLERMENGADVVTGWRKELGERWIGGLWPRLYNGMLSLMTGVRLHDHDCSFRCYRREVAKSVTLYGEVHRMLPCLATMHGYRTCELPIERRTTRVPGARGRLARGLGEAVSIAFLLRYRERPAHFIHGAAALFVLLGVWLASTGLRHGLETASGLILCLASANLVAFAWFTFLGGVMAEMLVRDGQLQNFSRPVEHRISSRPCRERQQIP